jgi:hypothetical protein
VAAVIYRRKINTRLSARKKGMTGKRAEMLLTARWEKKLLLVFPIYVSDHNFLQCYFENDHSITVKGVLN